jgi:Tol biopolymer transport system component
MTDANKKQSGGVNAEADGDINVGGNVTGRDYIETTTNVTNTKQTTTNVEGGPVARYAVVGIIVIAVVAILALAVALNATFQALTNSTTAPVLPQSLTSPVAQATAPFNPTERSSTPPMPRATLTVTGTSSLVASPTLTLNSLHKDNEAITFLGCCGNSKIEVNRGIFIMNADGSNQSLLINISQYGGISSFAWSPDTTKVLLFSVSRAENNEEIFLATRDGFSVINLTSNPAPDYAASWSPDGSHIAFVSERDVSNTFSINNEIYLMNADGTGVTRLTFMDPDLVRSDIRSNHDPIWSPNGSKIAFVSERDGNEEIYIMNADGSEQTNLTNNPDWDSSPTWSPSGRQITFLSTRGQKIGGIAQIWVMNSDGSGQVQLTNTPSGNNHSASWSPDGKKIAFVSDRDGNSEIYIMNPDGSEQTRLTHSVDTDDQPAWSLDGTRIAYVSNRDGNPEIYAVNIDGSERMRLTNNLGIDWQPAWQSWP